MDLRQHLRYLIQCAIAFKVNNHHEEGGMVNLSLAGCAGASPKVFHPGEHIALLVHLPDGQPPMEVDLATVRWSNGDQFGLEFVHLGQNEKDRLRQFLDSLETGVVH